MTNAEAAKAYDCVRAVMLKGYAKSGNPVATSFTKWPHYNTVPYVSDTHGSRFVSNYSNNKAYGWFEKAGAMPAGATMAKNSFVVSPNGKVSIGPLFLMEKMPARFNPESDNWRYTMIMPDGSITGVTNGKGSENVGFCIACHKTAQEHDSLFFIPAQYRAKQK